LRLPVLKGRTAILLIEIVSGRAECRMTTPECGLKLWHEFKYKIQKAKIMELNIIL